MNFFKEFMRLKLFHDKTKMLFVFLTMLTSVFIILRLIYLVDRERETVLVSEGRGQGREF